MTPETKDKAPDFGKVKPPPEKGDLKPKTEDAAPKPKTTRKSTTSKVPTLESQLEETFGGIAMVIFATGDTYCGEHLAKQAKPLAQAWAELAKQSPAVDRILRRMMEGSAWGAVIFVTASTVIPIAAHHNLYPKGFPMPFEFGIGPPPPPSDEVRKQGE